jgi:DNA repair exonuclease SbcCD nuclease subunit
MTIVHLADTHLGHRYLTKSDSQGRNCREQDIYGAFEDAIEKIIQIRPVAVVHAGDLFDSFHPSTEAMGVALDGFRRLKNAGIPTLVIAGNHSTPRYRATHHVFSLLDRYGSVTAVWDQPHVERIGELAITALPHDHDDESFEEMIRTARPDANARFNVLVLHAGVGSLPRVGAGEAGVKELNSGLLEDVAEFDYIALGHFHKYQPVRVNACYSGSLERLSFNDDAEEKVFLEVDLEAGAESSDWIKRHPVKTRTVLDLKEVDGREENLTEAVLSRLEGVELDGAVLRCPIRQVRQERYRELDSSAINTATADCLHFELKPEFIGAGTSRPRTTEDLRAHAEAATEEGFDVEEVLGRAEGFLADAETGLTQ